MDNAQSKDGGGSPLRNGYQYHVAPGQTYLIESDGINLNYNNRNELYKQMLQQTITQHVIGDPTKVQKESHGSFRDTASMMSANMTTGLVSSSSRQKPPKIYDVQTVQTKRPLSKRVHQEQERLIDDLSSHLNQKGECPPAEIGRIQMNLRSARDNA